MGEKIEVNMSIADVIETVKDTETVKQTDKTTALVIRAVHAALSPLETWVMQKEYNIEKTKIILADKLKNVPLEDIVTPPSYIGIPALQAISYCMDNDELREMYAELLKTAMNIQTTENVHPTYVEIIKQMSPYDAIIFKKLVEVLVQPCMGVSYRNIATGASYPIQDIVAFVDLEKYPLVPTQIALENLERLRLIEINKKSKYADTAAYTCIRNNMKKTVEHFIRDNADKLPVNEYEVVYNEYLIMIRGFGQFFARACLGEDFSNLE